MIGHNTILVKTIVYTKQLCGRCS